MPHSWFPSNGINRRVFNVALAALLAFTTLAVIPGATAPARAQTDGDTTDICGVDVLFILDESGSMEGDGEDAVREGFDDFVTELASSAPDSLIGVVEFSTDARKPFGNNWQAVTGTDGASLINYINNDPGAPSENYNADGWTNWEDALINANSFVDANSIKPDYVILITDGNPTTFANEPDGFFGDDPRTGDTMAEFGTVAAEDDYAALAGKIAGSDTIIGFGAGAAFENPGGTYDRLDRIVDTVTTVNPLSNLAAEIADLADELCQPSLDIEKLTNGQQADAAPGPTIEAGDPVNWTYNVTNNGPVTMYNIDVTDDNNDGATISCVGQANGSIALNPGESIVCTASSTSWYSAANLPHANTATAVGNPLQGPDVSDSDPSHYTPTLVCPIDPSGDQILLDIFGETSGGLLVNQGDSLAPIAQNIPAGIYEVQWASYDAHARNGESNPGQTQEQWYLDIGGFTSVDTADLPWDDDLINGTLATKLVVGSDQNSIVVRHGANIGGAQSIYPICAVLDPLDGSVDIDKTTDDSPVTEGGTATFEITVTNDGEVPLTDVSVSDPLTPACDFASGDTTTVPGGNFDGTLDVNESITFECTTDALFASFENLATVTGSPPTGDPVTDEDPEEVVVEDSPSSILVEKWSDTPDQPEETGTFEYHVKVTNTSDVDTVTITSLVDDMFGDLTVACGLPKVLGPGESFQCDFSEDITINGGGDHTNEVTASGTDDDGEAVEGSDTETVTIYAVPPEVSITKEADNKAIFPGDTVTYTLVITNDSDSEPFTITALYDEVWDGDSWENLADVCGELIGETLAPGASTDCTFEVVIDGDFGDVHENRVTVNGEDDDPEPQIDEASAEEEVRISEAYAITFTKQQCEYFGDIRANETPTNVEQNPFPLGAIIDADGIPVNADWENANQECNPVEDWPFTIGLDVHSPSEGDHTGLATSLSHAVDVTSVHYTDEDGSITIELTEEEMLGLFSGDYELWISEGRLVGGELVFDGLSTPRDESAWGFGALRCASDALNGDNAEFVVSNDFTQENGFWVDCYAYNVALDPSIDIEKSTNGEDADTPTGPEILVGDAVTWEYVVTNTGNVDLTGIVVTDDMGVVPVYQSGDAGDDGVLGVGEVWIYEASAEAEVGQYGNVGTVVDNNGDGVSATDSDASHYLGTAALVPSIDVEKSTNGEDADVAPGPSITVGDLVTWEYVVTNDGDVDLTGVVVTDDIIGDVCAIGDLAIGETKICEASGPAIAGAYVNVGTAEAGEGVQDTDPSNYFGQTVAASATIGDTVWNDENENGIQDNGEKGIAGATVRLTLPDATTVEANTNANGLYLFSALEAGEYKAELIMSSIPAPSDGDNKLTTAGSFTIQLLDGQAYLDADFGITATLPTTGISADTLALIALALLLAGALAILATRRREDTDYEGDLAA